MTDNEKAAGDGIPQTALKTILQFNFNKNIIRFKASVHWLTPWLFALEVFHV
jgi:hypothetical protein